MGILTTHPLANDRFWLKMVFGRTGLSGCFLSKADIAPAHGLTCISLTKRTSIYPVSPTRKSPTKPWLVRWLRDTLITQW